MSISVGENRNLVNHIYFMYYWKLLSSIWFMYHCKLKTPWNDSNLILNSRKEIACPTSNVGLVLNFQMFVYFMDEKLTKCSRSILIFAYINTDLFETLKDLKIYTFKCLYALHQLFSSLNILFHTLPSIIYAIYIICTEVSGS